MIEQIIAHALDDIEQAEQDGRGWHRSDQAAAIVHALTRYGYTITTGDQR